MPECHGEHSNGTKTMRLPESSRISVIAECAIGPTVRIDPSDDRLIVNCNMTRLLCSGAQRIRLTKYCRPV